MFFRFWRTVILFSLIISTSPAFGGWKRPVGIVATSVGGVTLIAGAIMLATPDSCRPDNESDECKKDKRENENNATPVLLAGAGLVTGGILMTIFGGDKSASNAAKPAAESVQIAFSIDYDVHSIHLSWPL